MYVASVGSWSEKKHNWFGLKYLFRSPTNAPGNLPEFSSKISSRVMFTKMPTRSLELRSF